MATGPVSRSPFQYLKRKQLINQMRPGPSFSPCELLVHQYPVESSLATAEQAEGAPPPDRAELRDWNPPC